ncbi:hypothetical protein ALP10_100674 [Pseudomonas syringae pv. helianthi]|uniref:Uncharacterized protein n=20 Tax=Pseudomonas syringae group TaxID=136849 RepID=A0A0P9KKJ0_9PSED|nr:hypothetical protein ALO80_100784 [Pseudomonas caricapapayae]KPY80752.1 hypothetical protein ALO44_100758 [Pseudomonas syringae pv. tagetis]RMR06286.1 hypothetical protein ALP93_100597 [Pseudomonas syringae pv. helianthi]RMM14206.1 hypothetical protein ALQ84_100727 [Pseudomonas caricapapayae]RMV44925.1 hypothetical protein ALP10_100674 [Pseudomonas syringae pv. helianthi]
MAASCLQRVEITTPRRLPPGRFLGRCGLLAQELNAPSRFMRLRSCQPGPGTEPEWLRLLSTWLGRLRPGERQRTEQP